jgi:hypothetical protein
VSEESVQNVLGKKGTVAKTLVERKERTPREALVLEVLEKKLE